jgi:pyrroloquinoline quinone biosynthesis protein B
MIDLPEARLSAVVLGNMQDGGLPHIGCRCSRCSAVYDGAAPQKYAASLAIVDNRIPLPSVWLIDASPDIRYQLDALTSILGSHPSRPGRTRQIDGIFLTHAHMGHIGGLPQLGPEAMAATDLPVYAASGLVNLLRGTALWQPLVHNLNLRTLVENQAVDLATGLRLTPIPVPHRDEWHIGTYAFHVQGPTNSLLYLPDIDAWEQWPDARRQLAAVDTALVDATFFDIQELGGRPPVAHPLVPHTLELFADISSRLLLTHLNHTNPLLDKNSMERQIVLRAGARIAHFGQVLPL